MNLKISIVLSLLVFGAYSGAACAETPPAASATGEQDTLSLLRAGLRMDHREFVKASMMLSDDEAAKFWTIYNQYEADMIKLNDRKWQLIQEYADNYDDVSEDLADDLVKNMFDLRSSRNDVLKKYYKKVEKTLSNRIGMRFVQIENVWNAASDLKIGTSMPLAPKQ